LFDPFRSGVSFGETPAAVVSFAWAAPAEADRPDAPPVFGARLSGVNGVSVEWESAASGLAGARPEATTAAAVVPPLPDEGLPVL
jgi:hypothetical protein